MIKNPFSKSSPNPLLIQQQGYESLGQELKTTQQLLKELQEKYDKMKSEMTRVFPSCPVCGGSTRQAGSKGYSCQQDNGLCGIIIHEKNMEATSRAGSGGMKVMHFHKTTVSMSTLNGLAEWLGDKITRSIKVWCFTNDQPIARDKYLAAFTKAKIINGAETK